MSQPYPTQPPLPPAGPPQPFNWRRWAIWTTVAAAVSFGVFGAIGASQKDDKPDYAGCKSALERQYEHATVGGPTPSGPPVECMGVDNKTLQRLVGEVISKELGESLDGIFSSPTATP
ncbi:hypothetical protein ACQEV4_01315 [Streptomyces shenzhenensis]|uniref:hypothetical protein n=1 Tax=Streptomyces shenzhenensis TaxID=943815 RepID=UPI003D8EAACE